MEKQCNNQRVLIVDDNRISRRISSSFLVSLGIQVEEAKDGYEAIELIKKFNYTAVFMNQYLPVMNGYETASKIRGQNNSNKIPIVLITTGDFSQLSGEMEAAGFSDVLVKPFQKDRLIQLMASFEHQDNGDSTPIFDSKKYEETYKDAELQKDIIETFLNEEKSDTKRIKTAFLTNDGDEIYSAVHYMKGSFSYLKASRILIVTQRILDQIKQKELDKALEYKDEFIEQYEMLVNELKKIKY